MNLVSGAELRQRLAGNPPLIEAMVDPEGQIQMNGVDFTVREVAALANEPGAISVDNDRRKTPASTAIAPDGEGWWRLPRGIYWVLYNEIVHIPADMFAIARTRSSLLRSGASVETAVWDSGYSGRSGSLLVVHHPAGLALERNARIVQLIFFGLDSAAEKLYRGKYHGENIS